MRNWEGVARSSVWFHSKNLRGKKVEVILNESLKVVGNMLEYFERNNNVVLEYWDMLEKKKKKWVKVDSGSLIVIKGNFWKMIEVKEEEDFD